MGYFNPAVLLGVLVQQWDSELDRYRRGYLGIMDNLKFTAIIIMIQFCGTVFGLLLWKASIFKKPSADFLGVWVMCPSNEMSFAEMQFT